MSKVLVTGGAGFVGSFLVDSLIENSHVVVFDNLEPQFHQCKPDILNVKAEFIREDVRDYRILLSTGVYAIIKNTRDAKDKAAGAYQEPRDKNLV